MPHLRRVGAELRGLDDEDLKSIPVVPSGMPLRPGATYINLAAGRPVEFTATGKITATDTDAYVARDEVPFDVWNQLTGEAKSGQER
jgi:hypothetical protein